MKAFLAERCEKNDPNKSYSDFFLAPTLFKEDETWSVIYLKAAYDQERYPKVSEAQECLRHAQAAWKQAMHGTSPWNLFAILMDGMEGSTSDELVAGPSRAWRECTAFRWTGATGHPIGRSPLATACRCRC